MAATPMMPATPNREAALPERMEDMEDVLFGNKRKTIPGVIPRLEAVEAMANKWRETSTVGKGVLIGLAFNLLGALGTLLAVLKVLQELQGHVLAP